MTISRRKFAVWLLGALFGAVLATSDVGLRAQASDPDEPVPLSPSNGAANVPPNATLSAHVSNPGGGTLTASLSVRRVTAQEFTIVVLPDTQFYSESFPATFTAQTQWIVDNREARNIVFVTHEGDVVDNAGSDVEWQRASASMSLLEVAGIPFGLAPGNHDQPTTKYNQYFGVNRFQGRPYYGGHYGSNNDNNYQLFSAGGVDFVILHLDYCPSTAVVAWGLSILNQYPERTGILTTHAYLDGSANRKAGGCTTQYLWDQLAVPSTNLRFMLSGHISNESRRTDVVGGRAVHQMLADYQGRSNGGNGWLRIMRFVPAESKVYVQTYSPTLKQFETDANSQFALDFAMTSTFEATGTEIVPSGTNVAFSPAGLDPFTTYEWKVTVTNELGLTRTGPTWSFTTGAGGGVINDPPTATPMAVTVPEDASTFITLDGSDPNGHSLTFQVLTSPSHGVLTGVAPNLTYQPAPNFFGSDSFTFRVRDGALDSAPATVSITVQPVNDPPQGTADSFSVASGSTLQVSAPGVLANDVDIDGGALSAQPVAPPAHGVLVLQSNGSFSYTPNGGFWGTDTFTYMAYDGLAGSAPVTVEVRVTPPPGAGNVRVITFEDGALLHPLTGVDVVTGAVTLETADPISGTASARVASSTAYLRELFDAKSDLYVSFHLKVAAIPSSDVYLLRILNGSSVVGTIQLRSTGRLRLRNNSTAIGAESAVLTPGAIYRVGIHQRARIGGTNNGVLEAWVAPAGQPLGGPFAALATGSWTTSATELRLGSITSVAASLSVDDIKIDDTAMPGSGPVAPSAPSAQVIDASTVQVSWTDGSLDETAFHIERAGSSGLFAEVGVVPSGVTTYVDSTAAPGTTYGYRVRAARGAEFSLYSDVAYATAPYVAPAPPSGLVTTIAASGVQLEWVDGSVSETLFSVERAGSNGIFAEITTVPAGVTLVVDATVSPNTTYSYRVRAGNPADYSGYSNTSTITTPDAPPPPPPPPPPTTTLLKLMTFESGTITDAATGADSVIGTVSFETAGPLSGTRSARFNSSAYLQEDFTASDDLHLSFLLQMPSLPSSDVRIALVMNGSNTVGNLYLRSTGQLRLRVGSTNVGSDSAALVPGTIYRVLLRQRGTPRLLEASVAPAGQALGAAFASTTTASWTGMATRARLGGTSGTANVVIDDVRIEDGTAMPGSGPVAPSAPSAQVIDASTVRVSWTDGSTDETAFHIERAGSSGLFAEVGVVPSGVTTYVDSTAAPGTTYGYRVRAARGAEFSLYSDVAYVTTPYVAPAPPSGLVTTNAASGVQLEWVDGSVSETLFSVERAGSNGIFAEITTVPAGVTLVVDTTVSPNTTYSYRVRAGNPAGYSGYSNTSTITTPDVPPPPPPPTTTLLKLMTFESGTITDAATGADSVIGTVPFETAAPLAGIRSARFNSSAYLQEDFTASDDLYLSFLLQVPSLPSSDVRIALVMNGSNTVGNLYLRSTGQLRLRVGSTNVGSDSAALVPGTIYRVLLRQRGTPRLLEASVAPAAQALGAAFASTTTASWTGSATRARLGGTNGTANVVIDDVRLEAGIP